MAGIYVHIPFCRQACHYCDFHFSTNRTRQQEMIASIGKELFLQKDYLKGELVQTIYFGGGTPSLLNTAELNTLLGAVAGNYALDTNAEVTLEANPDDLTEGMLRELRHSGINRLSIGIQSFNDNILSMLNRCHDSGTALSSFWRSREAGFDNITIDLIYSIPGLSIKDWGNSIRQAIDMAPDHISAYTLTIEPKTVFGHMAAKGKLKEVEEDTSAAQMEMLIDMLANAGYEQYEVSNFAKPGFQSQHNKSYWHQRNYLGVGPGAHSYNGASRQSNISNNNLYLKSIHEGHVPFQLEVLSRSARINEIILTSLRITKGCDLNGLKQKYDFDLFAHNSDYLQQLVEHELAVLNDSVLQLTRKGRLLADKIATDLFLTHDPEDNK
ncbi:MAG TPA: radical SAM family heme chaperone HemW [Cyclobacteriaceae bacterium]|nr:radical SAM family heme chaperone HemW [Cyclobacteriaceae bacterium]